MSCILDELLNVRSIDLPAHSDRQFEFVECADGFAYQVFAALGVKRKIARKQNVIGAEATRKMMWDNAVRFFGEPCC